MTTPAVELIDVRKSFGHLEALRGVSLRIEQGEVVAILGPNGAGKTTCINLMLGQRRPTAGTARLFGLSPDDRRARSRCGVMLQESGLLGQLRVRHLQVPMPFARGDAPAGTAHHRHRSGGSVRISRQSLPGSAGGVGGRS